MRYHMKRDNVRMFSKKKPVVANRRFSDDLDTPVGSTDTAPASVDNSDKFDKLFDAIEGTNKKLEMLIEAIGKKEFAQVADGSVAIDSTGETIDTPDGSAPIQAPQEIPETLTTVPVPEVVAAFSQNKQKTPVLSTAVLGTESFSCLD